MEKIQNIDGLTVDHVNGKRVVMYHGQECPLISREETLCEEDTSYCGCVLYSTETYRTPIGVVERTYWARGAGLERSGSDWRIVPVEEISDVQKRFEAVSIEMAKARRALEMVVESKTGV